MIHKIEILHFYSTWKVDFKNLTVLDVFPFEEVKLTQIKTLKALLFNAVFGSISFA